MRGQLFLRALEDACVEFIQENGGGPRVRLRERLNLGFSVVEFDLRSRQISCGDEICAGHLVGMGGKDRLHIGAAAF